MGQRQDHSGLECHARRFGPDATVGEAAWALKQEPYRAPAVPLVAPPAPQKLPRGSLLGAEEVNRETTGPHLLGLMGKEARQV